MGHIYLLRIGSIYKLGRSADWSNRWKAYQAYSPYQLKVIFSLPVPDEHAAEAHLLGLYGHQAMPGKNEWLRLTPRHVWRMKRYLLRLNRRTKPSPKPSIKGLNHANPVWDLLAGR